MTPQENTEAKPALKNRSFPVCGTCGSSDVLADAWASWNAETHDWELHSTFDEAHCNSCDGSTKLEWKEPEESKTERIRRLNDEMRSAILTDGVEPYGTMVITTGVHVLLRERGETVFGELKERIAN